MVVAVVGILVFAEMPVMLKAAAVLVVTGAVFLTPWIWSILSGLAQRAWLHGEVSTELSNVRRALESASINLATLKSAMEVTQAESRAALTSAADMREILGLHEARLHIFLGAVPTVQAVSVAMKDEQLLLRLRLPPRVQLLPGDPVLIVAEGDLSDLGHFLVATVTEIGEYECRPALVLSHQWWQDLTLHATSDQAVPSGVMMVLPINEPGREP